MKRIFIFTFLLGTTLSSVAQGQIYQPSPTPFAQPGIKNSFALPVNAHQPTPLRPPLNIYDESGVYRGKMFANPFDPDSIDNPFGRYGNPFSPDSIHNPFGAGNPFRTQPVVPTFFNPSPFF